MRHSETRGAQVGVNTSKSSEGGPDELKVGADKKGGGDVIGRTRWGWVGGERNVLIGKVLVYK